MMTRVAFQTAMRAAAVELLTQYRQASGIKLQINRGRPVSINPPTAFVDLIREQIEYIGAVVRQRTPQADVIVVHGRFDINDTVDQKDAFVDDFLDWVTDRYHAAGMNTLIAVVETEDIPNYVPDWIATQTAYYATRITLEGYAG
jgi:hypothetical protein